MQLAQQDGTPYGLSAKEFNFQLNDPTDVPE